MFVLLSSASTLPVRAITLPVSRSTKSRPDFRSTRLSLGVLDILVILHLDHISTSRYVINLLIVCVGVLSGGFGFVFSLIAIMKVYLK